MSDGRYPKHLFWSDEDEGFIAVAPDLPGSSAFGETEAEAIAELDPPSTPGSKLRVRLATPSQPRPGRPRRICRAERCSCACPRGCISAPRFARNERTSA